MIVEKVKQYDPRVGWNIVIKEFAQKDFKKFNILLNNIGMKKRQNKRLQRLLKNGLKIYMHKKYPSKIKRGIFQIKQMFMQAFTNQKIIQREFTSNNSFFECNYMPGKKFLTATWNSKKLDGEEFISIILSNIE